jgi:glycerol-3-phosphate dehydrogenase (NAD(P)+)
MDKHVRLVVFGVNSAGVDWAAARIGPQLKAPVPIVMLTKGLPVQNRSIVILPQVVEVVSLLPARIPGCWIGF